MHRHHVLSLAISIGLLGVIPSTAPFAADLSVDGKQAQNQSASPSGSSPRQSVSPSETSTGRAQVIAESPEYSAAMRRLFEAAQKLRDATHAMAAQPPGPARTKAIEQTNEALFETQRAMLQLPVELRQASASAPDHAKAMDKLKQAAQKLRDATHAMAAQPAGEGRNAAIRQTNDALLETQQAMIAIISQGSPSATTGEGSKR